VNRWVRLKSPKELIKAGFAIAHISDDGEFIRFGKGGTEVGIWQGPEPRLVVNCSTVHENLLKMFPDAFEEVEGRDE
jgi:hypothetical protein